MELTRRPTRKQFKQFSEEGTLDLEDWHKLFIELCDPTEYTAALALVGSWPEWQRFKKEWGVFRDEILVGWLAEVEVKIRSNAIRKVIDSATTDTKAAQWLAESKHVPKRAGKPSKAEVERQAKIEAGVRNEVEDDVTRVLSPQPLKVVQ